MPGQAPGGPGVLIREDPAIPHFDQSVVSAGIYDLRRRVGEADGVRVVLVSIYLQKET